MKILFVFGTRPEAIKLAPLVREFKNDNTIKWELKVCVTAQHREMLDQVLEFFNIEPVYDLNIMRSGQSLFDISVDSLKGLQIVLDDFKPNLVFVQGDTTTTFIGALASFYNKTCIAHVEAGLRSGNKYSPFPEEINRILAGHLADFHFAPTERARQNLKNEGIKENVWVVGNTAIDALFWGLEIIKNRDENEFKNFFHFVDFSKKVILVTGHRRESFGEPFENICYALREIIELHNDVEIVYPVHMNPNVRDPVNRILSNSKRIHLINPLGYPFIIWLMNKAYIVLTDSGGIQEEAPSLGKPVLVMRNVTERTEGIKEGTAKLVGTIKEKIVNEVTNLLNDAREYQKMANAINPYGDGKASQRIIEIVNRLLDSHK